MFLNFSTVKKVGYILNEFVNAALLDGMGLEAEYWVKLTQVYPGVYDDVQMLLANEIRKRRKQSGLTQIQLANQIFCSATTISNIEHGYIFPNMAVFNSICQHFKLMSGSLIYLSQLYCLYHHHHKLEGHVALPLKIQSMSKSPLDSKQATRKSERKSDTHTRRAAGKSSTHTTKSTGKYSTDATKAADKSSTHARKAAGKPQLNAQEAVNKPSLTTKKVHKTPEKLKKTEELTNTEEKMR